MCLSILALVCCALAAPTAPAAAPIAHDSTLASTQGYSAAASSSVQAPARDTRTVRTGTSRIRGRVLNREGSIPVRRAMVRLSSSEMRDTRSVMTDGDGNYEFRDVPSGTYTLMASKSGYLAASAGAAQPGDLGQPVKVGDGDAVSGINILLSRGGAVAGRILDEFGDPVVNVSVQVWRRQSSGGARRLLAVGSGGTNDLGQYRVFGLQPGSYYVSATTRDTGGDTETTELMGYAPTYYPGTPSITDAQPIDLIAGQDATGVDFMLTVARLARISGICIDSQGRPVSNASVMAMPVTSGGVMGGTGGSVNRSGAFTTSPLAPGEYLLVVRGGGGRGGGGRSMEIGQARVTVAGSDLSGITIQTSTGATLSGQVVYDGATPRTEQSTRRFTISTTPADPADASAFVGGSSSTQVDADGSFTLTGLFGQRLFRVAPPSGWMLKAIYVNGRDVSDAAVAFEGHEQVTGAQVVLTDKLTHVTGSITDDRGQPAEAAYVLVVADDPARWFPGSPSRYVRQTVVRDGGPLRIDGLPPADYAAVALKSTQGIDVNDPDTLERVRKAGVKFSLREGDTKDVALKVTAIR